MSDNPLLWKDGLPPFDRITSEHVEPAIRELLARLEQEIQTLEQHVQPTWDQAIERLNDLTEPLGMAWGVVNHLMSVKNSPQLRQAHEQVQGDVVMALMRLSQSEPIFRAVESLRNGAQWSSFDGVQQRIVDKRLLEARLSGIALQGAQRDRFNAIETELSELGTRFSNQLLDATKAFSLKLTTKDQVAGLPASLLSTAAQAARAAGEKDATPEHGPWHITLDAPSYVPFMKHSQRRELREQVYRAYVTRASSGALDNTALLDRILALRQEKAALLGFATYAELSLATKMAPGVDQAEKLLEDLRVVSLTAATKDLEDLRALARSGVQGVPSDGTLALWDVEFLAERLREQRFAFNDEELRPYFPLPGVLEGLFALTQKIFGVTVMPADGEAPVWHPDVRFFHVKDGGGRTVASFYLDPYSRPENKRGGAWMDDCIARRGARPGIPARRPVAYLVCNQTPPVDGKPSLMSFQEVETLFHEFGHGLQHMLTTVDYLDASGIRGVEWDAVELPSQFMENWCYHRETLMGLSRHVDTGERLPDHYFQKILAARTYRAGSQMLRQIYLSRMDLELHHRYKPGGSDSVFDVQRRIAKDTTVLPPLPEDRFLCGFSHIFAGGYAAGYYSYKWAEVLSADAFAAFEEAGLDDSKALVDTGTRFLNTVLALGGSIHPMDVFKAFRGRGPTTEALLRHSGLRP